MILPFARQLRPVLKLLLLITPLRSYRVRQHAISAYARVMRALRRRLEARGDDRWSHPAAFEMDSRLVALLGDGGTFLEAGGHDGYTHSNTYFMERFHGWRGLLVEPAPELAREARRERSASAVIQCALVPPELAGQQITLHYAGLLTIVDGARGSDEQDREWISAAFLLGERDHRTFTAPGRTLSDVIASSGLGEIDLLTLDLEGYEPQALRGLELARGPRWMLVEAHDDEARDQIEEVIGDGYVRVERFSPMDMLYRRADVPAPPAAGEAAA